MTTPVLFVIDDDPAMGKVISRVAEECGYRASVFLNSAAFQAEFERRRCDLIALDLGIPGGDGVEILRYLAAENCKVPIVLISGFDRRVLQTAMNLGDALKLRMEGPLMKPVRLQHLRELFSRVKPGPYRGSN